MKKLFVFTNQDSLSVISPAFGGRPDIQTLSDKNNFLYFVEHENIFKICSNFTENGLYFIYDDIKTLPIDDYSDLFILKHRLPTFTFSNFPEGRLRIGIHEPKDRDGRFYPDLVSILEDENSDKTDRIFKSISKSDVNLRAKIKLIQAVLSGERPTTLDKDIPPNPLILESINNLPSDKNVFSPEFQDAFNIFHKSLEIE